MTFPQVVDVQPSGRSFDSPRADSGHIRLSPLAGASLLGPIRPDAARMGRHLYIRIRAGHRRA
ncbi:hypothetical protein I540_0647 [Mycobacteroides abscessus subsp. bolletii 1513]|uniref:Uncharacterized protein n=1 Tax=Mycobacteroides abscessus subsp. bolletii 1513 TaxID=1299321 RepID=X8E0L7_9MYCO|nr:hypothetical protein L831_0644 [Mycobacteroides abscessus MAB_082312_2272]EUA74169.1 hypothetical protein I540_0647 [Mycobacteroides abscessus subsp. bolletii 1513]